MRPPVGWQPVDPIPPVLADILDRPPPDHPDPNRLVPAGPVLAAGPAST